MARSVRVVGDPDLWEVIGETPTSMILVNPAARQRRDIAALETQLAELRQALEAAQSGPIEP